MAAGAPDARADGGAAPGGGSAAAARAIEPGGDRPAARGEWRERVPLGGDAGARGPSRLASAPADRPAGAPRCTGLGAPGPAAGAGGGGGRLRDRAMDPAAHRGADPAGVRGGPSSALPGAAAEGARLFGAAPGHPGAGARRARDRRLAAPQLG